MVAVTQSVSRSGVASLRSPSLLRSHKARSVSGSYYGLFGKRFKKNSEKRRREKEKEERMEFQYGSFT